MEQAENLRGMERRFLHALENGRVVVARSSHCAVAGVLVEGSRGGPGAAVCVARSCLTKVIAGAPLREGSDVASDDQGRAVPATSGCRVVGIAESSAAAAGEVVEVLLDGP
jgi:hypothetical protein